VAHLFAKKLELSESLWYNVEDQYEEQGNDMDLLPVMQSLSRKRPVFHSEADFQFAFAWEIQSAYPEADIRLEVPVIAGARERIDILVRFNGKRYPIELKHLTQDFDIEHQSERFTHKYGYVHSLDAYACVKDIQRVETWVEQHSDSDSGFVVWLANDAFWWKSKPRPAERYIEFSLHEAAIKRGTMKGNIEGKQKEISLCGEYTIHWRNYSALSAPNGVYKYVLMQI
jgi:hypothetical protein